MNTLRFVVMGDTHYVQPDAHFNALNGRPNGITEFADITRNYWMTKNVLPDVISSISSLNPDFVIQTGDIMQGHCDEPAGGLREMEEALELLKGLQAPLFFALGTHDGIPGREDEESVMQLVYPAIGKALGTASVTKGYYTFEKADCLFIVLDYTTYNSGDEQSQFLRSTLAASQNYEHVFLFGHPPLIPVGRPFFTKLDFVNDVLKELSDFPVDAYFCGHTHNQVTTLHQIGSHWMPQLKSTVLGYPDREPVPLSEVRPPLLALDTFEYGWGYMEDSAPGWWLITVNGPEVKAEWHVLRKGVQGELQWHSGEKPVFTKKPELNKSVNRKLPLLVDIRSVRLRAAGDSCRAPEAYSVKLNNEDIGKLPPLEYFDARQQMEIAQKYWPLLQEVNVLTVTTADEPMTIGGFVLEVETADGIVRSTVSDFYSSSDKWNPWGKHSMIPVRLGEKLNLKLSFSK